jgi:hypothetical protein
MKGMIRGRSQVAGTIVVIDQKRMDKALAEENIEVPPGLSREEKRAYILKHSGKKDGDDSSGRK